MIDNKKNRDILDLGSESYPSANMPSNTKRPVVSPQEGGYFLNKFLDLKAEAPEDGDAGTPVIPESPEALRDAIVCALQEIYDPEIPVNIYELGLIYDVDVAEDFSVKVRMTLTTPHCPVAESMPGDVELKVAGVPGVASVEVALVWEPAWDMAKMSDEARLELGLL